jgi:hypothetical protein
VRTGPSFVNGLVRSAAGGVVDQTPDGLAFDRGDLANGRQRRAIWACFALFCRRWAHGYQPPSRAAPLDLAIAVGDQGLDVAMPANNELANKAFAIVEDAAASRGAYRTASRR